MSVQFVSVINSAGPASGDYLGGLLLDPRDDVSQHPHGVVVLQLTSLDGTFSNATFLVPDAVGNGVLATALAAINGGKQVLADVDWPQPTYTDVDGTVNPLNKYCYSLFINSGQ